MKCGVKHVCSLVRTMLEHLLFEASAVCCAFRICTLVSVIVVHDTFYAHVRFMEVAGLDGWTLHLVHHGSKETFFTRNR